MAIRGGWMARERTHTGAREKNQERIPPLHMGRRREVKRGVRLLVALDSPVGSDGGNGPNSSRRALLARRSSYKSTSYLANLRERK
ncbi:hypothetical protein ACLOJK_018517 [Asimina triloba]